MHPPGSTRNRPRSWPPCRPRWSLGRPLQDQGLRAAKRSRLLGGWSRRKKLIALAAVATAVVAIGLGLGLGLGLAQNHGASGAGVTPAQVIWKNLHPKEPLPPARYFHEMVNDPTSGRLIMFGGDVDTPDGIREPSGDTWAYDPSANTWTELGPSGPPSARAAPAMAYDPATRRVIMFGGERRRGWNFTRFGDTWAYDPVANTWAQLSPAGPAPAGRAGHVMVYDPPSGRILMFGGGDEEEENFLNDLWAFDATTNTWTELIPTGALPAGRTQSAMAYDPVTRRMILFGGWDLRVRIRRHLGLRPGGERLDRAPSSGHAAASALRARVGLRPLAWAPGDARWWMICPEGW